MEEDSDEDGKQSSDNAADGHPSQYEGSRWPSDYDYYDFTDDITSNLKPLDLKLTLNAVS